jgi:hypothetical protein
LCDILIEEDVTYEKLEQFVREVAGIVEDDDPSSIDIDQKIVEGLAPEQVTLEKTKRNSKALIAFIA